ncbi:ABC transporter substrate-binding protein [Cryobacterium tepidiphilum]|uniref:ABC transporter substrate-binding protein n=1 Tax=Cryobacterium tepidiphilum TaxID=2486026 RepID=A0A3M8L264_9MICO|nr:ABC transporter substrate-binding protein [Cryobacterium tepidiphilum]RNE59466.1 ABC transporter substrate-binding protein [Cryobacterium tepidiphilum]
MFTSKRRALGLVAGVAGMVVALSGCASADPIKGDTAPSSSGDTTTLVVGSQDYYSNEIVAEIYAQALENNGYNVERDFRIGVREVYLPDLEAGKIDVFPEYTGSLLQALDKNAKGGTKEEVHDALADAVPDTLRVLDAAGASDQNSWTVTEDFAKKYNLTDLASLKNVTEPITVGGNSELQTRPYGPKALKEKYGIDIAGFTPVEDSGGPLTVKALVDGDIQLANIYTADPNIKSNHLVALKDPDGLFFPDNIVPVVSKKVDDKAIDILNTISGALGEGELVDLNSESVNDKKQADVIASEWLKEKNLF